MLVIGGAGDTIAKVFDLCAQLFKCLQCGLWIWMVFGLRYTDGGDVAAGRMVTQCERANRDLERTPSVVGGGPSCNGPFLKNAEKVISMWVIISCFMCK